MENGKWNDIKSGGGAKVDQRINLIPFANNIFRSSA